MTLQLHVYSRHEIPPLLAAQIRSYTRVQWPGLGTDTALWPVPPEGKSSIHFLLTDGELLVSHASTRIRHVTHDGTDYRVAGLSAVFTYPDYRGGGCGERVVRAATDHIRSGDGDMAILFCGDRVKPLYERLGWVDLPTARIAYGDPVTIKTDNHVLAMFLSERGKFGRPKFESDIVHVGSSTW